MASAPLYFVDYLDTEEEIVSFLEACGERGSVESIRLAETLAGEARKRLLPINR
jgi:hypothetical protein